MKFRRKSTTDAVEATEPPAAEPQVGDDQAGDDQPGTGTARGPFDVDDLPDDDVARVDLGSLLLEPAEGLELRLQVDDATGTVEAVLLAGEEGALELRAFAAPRNGDLWSEVRPQIAADMSQRGGAVGEREGPFGTELLCQLEVQAPDGSPAVQPSRIIGVNGPRWMLRATLLGRPAVEVEASAEWEELISRVGVRRGSGAMPVGDALPVVLPPEAQLVEEE